MGVESPRLSGKMRVVNAIVSHAGVLIQARPVLNQLSSKSEYALALQKVYYRKLNTQLKEKYF